MIARETPVVYVTEPWDHSTIALQNSVDSDGSLLAAANAAHNPDLYYESPAGAIYAQSENTQARGKILGKVIFPAPSEQLLSVEKHRWKRFAVVIWQNAADLSGEIRFIPTTELPISQDPGSLKTLRFSNVRNMILHAGGSAESIGQALAEIPASVSRSHLQAWKKRGGHPARKGSMKRRAESYHFHKYPARFVR